MREGAAEALDKARELCKEGKYRSADQLFRKNILRDCAAYHIACTMPSGCRVSLNLEHPDRLPGVAQPNGWALEGQGSNGGTRFKIRWPFWLPEPPLLAKGSTIILDSAREVLVLSSISTDYNIREAGNSLTHSPDG